MDYVRDEEGARWVTPASRDELMFGPFTEALDLVVALHRLGRTTREGLDVIAATWDGFDLQDATHWQEVRALNDRIAETLVDRQLCSSDATDEDFAHVIEHWTFPLTQLDLKLVSIDAEDLKAQRARALYGDL